MKDCERGGSEHSPFIMPSNSVPTRSLLTLLASAALTCRTAAQVILLESFPVPVALHNAGVLTSCKGQASSCQATNLHARAEGRP